MMRTWGDYKAFPAALADQPLRRSPGQSPRPLSAMMNRNLLRALPACPPADTVVLVTDQVKGTAMADPRLNRIADLLTLKADGRYGLSDVNQRQHALQTAWLAEKAGCPDALVVASLLHDIGHLVHDLGDNSAADGLDDLHEERGCDFLRAWFAAAVTEPVRQHVAAKRYLCAVEADYFAKLAPDSVLSLSLQGGPMSPDEIAAFNAAPEAAAAVRLRRFDEQAKIRDLKTPPVDHFLAYVERCLLPVKDDRPLPP
jgi:[1-hydroxy-2-(trimethylamino)ethyl]phosphonate dioxygenase